MARPVSTTSASGQADCTACAMPLACRSLMSSARPGSTTTRRCAFWVAATRVVGMGREGSPRGKQPTSMPRESRIQDQDGMRMGAG